MNPQKSPLAKPQWSDWTLGSGIISLSHFLFLAPPIFLPAALQVSVCRMKRQQISVLVVWRPVLSVISSGITEPVQLDTRPGWMWIWAINIQHTTKSLHLSLPNRHQKVLIHNPHPLPLRASLDKRKTALFQRCSAIIQCSQACLGVTKQFAFSVCCSWYRYEFEKSARGRERGKERAHRFSALSAAGYQLLFTSRMERCVVLWLLINLKGKAHPVEDIQAASPWIKVSFKAQSSRRL